jgi:hypothetical protein
MLRIFFAVSVLAVLATMCIVTATSRPVGSATAQTERNSEASVPVAEMMVGTKNLPVQSFSAF